MKKNNENLQLLFIIVSVCLVISNVLSSKLINLGFVSIPGGIVCYAITYLATDIINEIWGSKHANRAVIYGLISQVIACSLIFLTQVLPAADQATQSAFEVILGNNFFFVVASLVSYIISQLLDVYLFQKLRQATRYKWIRNNVSTIVSQAVDSIVYLTIAFGIGYMWLFNGNIGVLVKMFAGQLLVKIALALLDTPFFYLFTRKVKEEQKELN